MKIKKKVCKWDDLLREEITIQRMENSPNSRDKVQNKLLDWYYRSSPNEVKDPSYYSCDINTKLKNCLELRNRNNQQSVDYHGFRLELINQWKELGEKISCKLSEI